MDSVSVDFFNAFVKEGVGLGVEEEKPDIMKNNQAIDEAMAKEKEKELDFNKISEKTSSDTGTVDPSKTKVKSYYSETRKESSAKNEEEKKETRYAGAGGYGSYNEKSGYSPYGGYGNYNNAKKPVEVTRPDYEKEATKKTKENSARLSRTIFRYNSKKSTVGRNPKNLDLFDLYSESEKKERFKDDEIESNGFGYNGEKKGKNVFLKAIKSVSDILTVTVITSEKDENYDRRREKKK